MEHKQLKKAILDLCNYSEKESYSGYSLFDSHTSPIPFNKFPHKVSFLINQVIKRSPVNLRPLIGIKKQFNPKGMGLFLYAYTIIESNRLMKGFDNKYKVSYFFNWLNENYCKNHLGKGWGYHYDWPKSDGTFVPKDTPNSVVTAFNSRAVFEYYQYSKSQKAYNLLIEAQNFILNNTHKIEDENGICFSYTPLKKDITINASLLAAEVLAYSDFIQKKDEFENIISKVLDFTMNRQNSDGSWYYSFDVETNKPKKQIDFHQGYVLDSIYRLCKYSNISIDNYRINLKKGLNFYYNNQFNSEGRSLWRYPSKWPVDIHNQSQGIITFSTFSDFDEKYLPFALKIAKWTIKNMQNKKGGFYYQKWPIVTNRVSYMRWNNAWMMVALSTLLSKLNMKRS
jgi:hypothetical protein